MRSRRTRLSDIVGEGLERAASFVSAPMQVQLWCLIVVVTLSNGFLVGHVIRLENQLSELSNGQTVVASTTPLAPTSAPAGMDPTETVRTSLPLASELPGSVFVVHWQWTVFSLSSVLITALISLGLLRSVRAHSSLADEISRCRQPLLAVSSRAAVPELADELVRVNRLMAELNSVAEQIRRASEDYAHALKSPLSVVKIAVRRVRAEAPAGTTMIHAALDAAEANIDQISHVIEASQSLEEQAAALIVAPRQTIDVGSVVCSVLQQCRELATEKALRVSSFVQGDVLAAVPVGALDALVQDLLHNAIATSSEGGTIGIWVEKDVLAVSIRIEDDGAAIAADCLESTFEHDYSASGSAMTAWNGTRRRRRYFIAKRNAGLLGGELIIVNKLGRGVVVECRLPAL